MKLYVWEDVFSDYTSGIAFAIAKDAAAARRQILDGPGYHKCDCDNPAWHPSNRGKKCYSCTELAKEPDEYPLDEPIGFAQSGGG